MNQEPPPGTEPGPTGQPVAQESPPGFKAAPSPPIVALKPPAKLRLRGAYTMVSCDIACRAHVQGRVWARGAHRFKGPARMVEPGQTARLPFRVGKRARTAACRALATGRKVTVRFAVTAEGTGGKVAIARRALSVKRC